MKRLMFIIAILAMYTVQSFAMPAASADARSFRSQVMSVIRDKGYSPSIDDDGDVKFRVDGNTYWITVKDLSDGYAIKVFTVGSKSSSSQNAMLRAANSTMKENSYCSIIVADNVYSVRYFAYCETIQDFKKMFPVAVAAVTVVEREFLDAVN